jgi:hypothetical protein
MNLFGLPPLLDPATGLDVFMSSVCAFGGTNGPGFYKNAAIA